MVTARWERSPGMGLSIATRGEERCPPAGATDKRRSRVLTKTGPSERPRLEQWHSHALRLLVPLIT
jgi:hypothetical protein